MKWFVEEADATPDLQTKKGHTARLFAKKHGHGKVAVYLAEVGKLSRNLHLYNIIIFIS